jgi:hypothetical protein
MRASAASLPTGRSIANRSDHRTATDCRARRPEAAILLPLGEGGRRPDEGDATLDPHTRERPEAQLVAPRDALLALI